MVRELSAGRWHSGRTSLSFFEGRNDLTYRIKSEYDEDVDQPDPPVVEFTPDELRELIQQTRDALPSDPFIEGDFGPLADWMVRHGEDVIAEVGNPNGERKQFVLKENDETGTPYLKVQRRWLDENGEEKWLRDSPTLGPGEFEGVFGPLAVL